MEKEMKIKQALSKKPIEMNALTLAYMGDAIYETYIRRYVVANGGKPNILHRRAINFVSAKAQSSILHELMPYLSEKEEQIVKRGRNAKSHTSPKNADVIQYRHSTAFEALLGFLYLENKMERLEEIIEMAIKFIEGNNDGENNGR